MVKIKIINDPVYGFIELPSGLILSIVDHPWFQRLRRIRQGGFSQLVYPGATHTRFHHALGAYHLGSRAVSILRRKKIDVSPEEAQALRLALLLHDMGHGPFSHSLERLLIPVEHEEITLLYLESLNQVFDGKLSLAIQMFKNEYYRPFFYQLISGELDLDRMDYLARDSFFSGVSEGVIGYDRIIHMLNVVDDRLVIEEKGLNSIEKFLLARKLMYAQVYHHKMVVASEEMLRLFFEHIRFYINENKALPDLPIVHLMQQSAQFNTMGEKEKDEMLNLFGELDDSDVIYMLKSMRKHDDIIFSIVADGLISRKLFRYQSSMQSDSFDISEKEREYINNLPPEFVRKGKLTAKSYSQGSNRIEVLMKNGKIRAYDELRSHTVSETETRNYICYPRNMSDLTWKVY